MVGLVIGGIWGAAVAVQQEKRRSDIRAVLLHMEQKSISVFMGTPMPDSTLSLTQTLFEPSDIVNTPSLVATQFDAITAVARLPSGIYAGMAQYFTTAKEARYTLGPLNKADCIWVLKNIMTLLPRNRGRTAWSASEMIPQISLDSIDSNTGDIVGQTQMYNVYNVFKGGCTTNIVITMRTGTPY